MNTRTKRYLAGVVGILLVLFATSACDYEDKPSQQYKSIEKDAKHREAYIPHNGVEFNNYNKAQKLYDAKDSIIWCTTTWGNANSPLVTVPIRGKLTSSSVSYFSNTRVKDYSNGTQKIENRSVDGMYHGSPPPYRYGFTPGGQYIDFTDMPTLCTTALSKFQREKTDVTVTFSGGGAQNNAEDALKNGNAKGAEDALKYLETK